MIATRRAVLFGAAASLAAVVPAAGHTPYRQWAVYRQKHLLLGCHRGDDEGYALAKQAAAHLADHLPASRARVARAPAASRLAGLLATGQLDLAVLERSLAAQMAAAEGVFAAYGTMDLEPLASLGPRHDLYAHPRFSEEHASLVRESLPERAAAR